jgi:hypothetical protein
MTGTPCNATEATAGGGVARSVCYADTKPTAAVTFLFTPGSPMPPLPPPPPAAPQERHAPRLTHGRAELTFSRHGDRWQHRVAIDGRMVAESVEDGPAARWPASPPLVDLSTATIAGRQTLVAVGLAGRSHFSASITPHPTRPDTFLFEIAARIHDRDAGLGSTYATAPAPAAPVRITPPADGPAGLPRTVQWVYTIGPDGIVAGRG